MTCPLPTRLAGALLCALAATLALAAPEASAGPRAAPQEMVDLGVKDPRLVLSRRGPGGVWRVWTGRAQGRAQGFVAAPARFAGGQCVGLLRRQLVSFCLWGSMTDRSHVALGRVSPRAARIVARTGSGAQVPLSRRRGMFLVISSAEDPARVLIAYNRKGRVIGRSKVGSRFG